MHERLGPREQSQFNAAAYSQRYHQPEPDYDEPEPAPEEEPAPDYGRGGRRGRGRGRRPPPLVAPEQPDAFQRGAPASLQNQARAWNKPAAATSGTSGAAGENSGGGVDPMSPLSLALPGTDWNDMLGGMRVIDLLCSTLLFLSDYSL